MWTMKKCPRCRGDIYTDEDVNRSFEKCLQCGYERELLKSETARKVRKADKENPAG